MAIEEISSLSKNKINVIITSKGFATKKGETFNEIVENKFHNILLSILTGPTFAEIANNKLPAAIVLLKRLIWPIYSRIICNSNLRLYPSNDPSDTYCWCNKKYYCHWCWYC